MRAEQITEPVAYHGEGPVWSGAWGGLRWLDMLAGDVLSLASDGTIARRHVGAVVAAIRPRRRGGAVIAVERGFALEDADGTVTPLDPLWTDDGVRMNEGGCDPDGRFYCGSMAYDQREGAAAVHRLDPDGSVATVIGDVTVSNGLEWSPGGGRAYYADTATGRVDVFDYDRERGLTGRRPFAAVPAPDGLTVDEEGGVWVALYGGGSVRRYAPDGTLDEVVEVPVTKTTACAFGGDGLDRLFITTSREDLDAGDEPDAGSLFACTPGVRGVPVREFAG
ncbi:SMP-30/gluconolactonase/LRE family protein [Actinomadura sp. 7K507]|uniref:SMP-30/gluconolactonase/LRE family protein n=1 Tax=Actinomadura sp. 7K507 TaxID=2530365 RepID=UPI0010512CE3|nr:SMP-30/gluconolactonase/LRE family protein [Actinomadura sp. 7K507]TDC86080.1 SMP-30/gluconolactonase/LRE family protein [Actinomadura sp. 7K507]